MMDGPIYVRRVGFRWAVDQPSTRHVVGIFWTRRTARIVACALASYVGAEAVL